MNEKKTSVHGGMDYKGETGTPVKAVNSGRIVLNEELFFGGNTLIIDHGMGLFSVYMHLSEFRVSKDEKVLKGQIIGLVGMSGRATGPHLHLGVKLHGTNVNPLSLFKLDCRGNWFSLPLIVLGGFELISNTTLLMPFTSLIILLDIVPKLHRGAWPSHGHSVYTLTALIATTFS
jgi:murein DD-endopeptidase MepM/ murein hydrolase activator NlpD